MTDDVRRSRNAFFLVGAVVPAVILLATTAVVASWLPELPDPVATHWGPSGVDGFSPRWFLIVLPLGVGGGTVALMVLLGAFGHRLPQSSTKPSVPAPRPTSRLLAGVGLGLALMFACVSLVTTQIQRGLAYASQAPDIGWWMLAAFTLLAGGTALGWFLQPRSPEHHADQAPIDAIALAETERAAWFGAAAMSRGAQFVLFSVVLLTLGLSFVVFAQSSVGGWIMMATSALLIVMIATMLVFRVRVSPEGLRVRSVAGWPSIRIPLDLMTRVEAAEIAPMAEFGGWGWRVGADGRRGVVLRAGEALQVTDVRGKVFVVTVDGARDAASVLESLRERADRS